MCGDSFDAALWSRVHVLAFDCGASQYILRRMTWYQLQALQRSRNSGSRLLPL
ncbi:hypothetical protein HBH56_027830 [Parastagonospora nodorum]|uniref:Uncharacterized protein n=1 Tax=Phaeosphaeria nodorum (strain SN15 / ATCC MYA-4574 / FGSC 10173) TaxID=321614 RepID=A0A7U2F5D4_PHANO|nr:hypothetical protein HBH56_027830 [Parastagonospora nodorum]QRC99062.1 hypothetical protein JI435_064080 [Parastagonospora nodorum SN15]KAH3934669.1 hypothetical protein HBH54_054210 [Parastagonospora nodorum]KAH3975785.1 hypothetical protein HBH51_083460 [Parastagonospora nodorum]KAH3984888.1 hypothetical protein HBH52_053030 [Parastagonospora nodorum]